jgi:hypothetical protein
MTNQPKVEGLGGRGGIQRRIVTSSRPGEGVGDDQVVRTNGGYTINANLGLWWNNYYIKVP